MQNLHVWFLGQIYTVQVYIWKQKPDIDRSFSTVFTPSFGFLLGQCAVPTIIYSFRLLLGQCADLSIIYRFRLFLVQCAVPTIIYSFKLLLGQCAVPTIINSFRLFLGQCACSPNNNLQFQIIVGTVCSPNNNLQLALSLFSVRASLLRAGGSIWCKTWKTKGKYTAKYLEVNKNVSFSLHSLVRSRKLIEYCNSDMFFLPARWENFAPPTPTRGSIPLPRTWSADRGVLWR